MTTTLDVTPAKKHFSLAEIALSLGLFLLALLPRAYDLARFVTADEAKWVYRSAQFLAAFLQGDFAATTVNLTPAVTTTWLGSLGLIFYHFFHQPQPGLSFIEWLRSLPEFRTELAVLVATRWPMVIFTSLGVVVFYGLARRLFSRSLAFTAAALVALCPHFVALSRILGHDAPTAVFMVISLLSLLLAISTTVKPTMKREDEALLPPRPSGSLLWLSFSGLMAGLAFLSKAPALFLIPFVVLIFAGRVWQCSTTLYFWFKRLLLWLVVAYLTFVVFWPAAWVDPVGRPLAVFENAFLSATDQEEAEDEGYWLVPDLGPAYYLVNGGFKLSPLVLAGVVLAVWYLGRSIIPPKNKNRIAEPGGNNQTGTPPAVDASSLLLWLLVFVVLFAFFLTLSDKRSSRYILPAFPPLALLAAFGWLRLWNQVSSVRYQVSGDKDQISRSQMKSYLSHLIFPFLLTLTALIILLPYAPYYFTYFNPLLGGSYAAPKLVKIGWGEGLDQVGRFLQREQPDSRVGTAYASTVASYFKGDLSSVDGDRLDYVVLYRKQVQAGEPSPAFIRYFEHFGSIFLVNQNGIRYAEVYPGPALQKSLALTPGLDHGVLPLPIGFRPLTPYGHLGEPLAVDVLWLADDPLPATPSTVTLQPLSVFDFLSEHNHPNGTAAEPREITILAEGQGWLAQLADDLIVSRHQLSLPASLERGQYALLVDGRPLGEIELRNFQVPAETSQVDGVVFGEQIALAGYQFRPNGVEHQVTIAWRAEKPHLPDYTVFVQLLDAETNERLAGVDTPPQNGKWPTSRWVKNEVVVDVYGVATPPEMRSESYRVIVGLYLPETGQRLILANGQDHWTLP